MDAHRQSRRDGVGPALDRRDFCRSLLGTVLGYGLIRTLLTGDLLAASVKPITDAWLRGLQQRCADLKTGSISLVDWQDAVERLLASVPAEDLFALIDFEALSRDFPFPDLGAETRAVVFPKLEGLPERLAFFSKIFGLRQGRAIIPHGHRNMVSCHLVLQGEFALKQYDRVEDQPEHLVIRPTVDRKIGPGHASSISDDRNNVHWFHTLTPWAFTFDVIIVNLRDRKYAIENLDPDRAERLAGGTLRVAKLGVDEALERYGNHDHHPAAS